MVGEEKRRGLCWFLSLEDLGEESGGRKGSGLHLADIVDV